MNVIVRRIGVVIGSLCLLVVLTAGGGYMVSQRNLTRKYDIGSETIPIPVDSASIARGRHLTRAMAKCTDCHGTDLGGRVMSESGAMGRWVAPNLTSGKGGVAGDLSDAEWVRAIRHGVGPDGRPLFLMPANVYQRLAVVDVGDIVAYVKSVAPVDRTFPEMTFGPVTRGLIATNKVPFLQAAVIDHAKRAPAMPPPAGPTVEFGDYIVHTAGCDACHGPTLAGGKIDVGDPSWPPAANLTPTGLKKYDEAAFFTALRTGVRPDGTRINEAMPWVFTREMTDDETRAVWLYLKTVPPREFGAR